MNYVTEAIQDGLRRIAKTAFRHLHELDLVYHRQSSKNTVFAINRALRSVDTGLRFFLGFAAQMGFELAAVFGAVAFSCGKKYLGAMIATFILYAWYTKVVSAKRIGIIKEKMQIDKKQEFF